MLTINIENIHITLNFPGFSEKKESAGTLSVSPRKEKLNAEESLDSQVPAKVNVEDAPTPDGAETSVEVALTNDSKKDLSWPTQYSASLPLFQALNKSAAWNSQAFKYGINAKTVIRRLTGVHNDKADSAVTVPSFVLKNKTVLQALDHFCNFVETKKISNKIISQHVLLGIFNFLIEAKESYLPNIIQVLQEASITLQNRTGNDQSNPRVVAVVEMLGTWPKKAPEGHFDIKFKPVSEFIKSELMRIFSDSVRNANIVEQMALAH